MRVCIIVFFVLIGIGTALGQMTDDSKANGQVKFDRPTVFIEYVCGNRQKARLRLVNNTIWAITVLSDQYYPFGGTVRVSSNAEYHTLPEDKEVSLFLHVDRFALPWEQVAVPKVLPPDSGVSNWIASGHSTLFSVPTEYLTDKLEVYVDFNYEWELRKNNTLVGGPEHRVIFRGIDLPESIQPCR